MSANPVLVEVTRGGRVECVHRGAIAVARPGGVPLLAFGDVTRPVYPRSAIKAFQAVPLIETGALDRFGLADADLALAVASHSGTPAHVARAAAMLARAGLGEAALGCGAHEPTHEASARSLAARGDVPNALHNNCSGKHAGMVLTAAHLGEPVEGYLDVSHPVQVRIRSALASATGRDLAGEAPGIDGCSAPNWAVPLADLARAFARLGSGEELGERRAATFRRIMAAAWAAPEMVAGPGRLDTLALGVLRGRAFLKTGAEGVYCGALPAHGVGFALKLDDGARRASEAVVTALLARLLPEAAGLGGDGLIRNWRGTVVGEIRVGGRLDAALDVLPA